MAKTVWVLTVEYNDYDQHGDYFVAVFKAKPTADALKADGVPDHQIPNVLAGIDSRRNDEYHWYSLREVELK